MLHFIKLGHHTIFMLQQVLQHINQHFNIPNYSLQVQQRFRPWKWIPVWDSQEVLQLCPVELLPPDLRLASRLFSNYKSKWCGQADRRQRRTELQLQQAEGLLRAGHHKLFSHCLALIADEACGNRIVSGARGYSCFETCSNEPNVVCGFESWWVCPTREQRSHIPGSILRQVRFESKSNRKLLNWEPLLPLERMEQDAHTSSWIGVHLDLQIRWKETGFPTPRFAAYQALLDLWYLRLRGQRRRRFTFLFRAKGVGSWSCRWLFGSAPHLSACRKCYNDCPLFWFLNSFQGDHLGVEIARSKLFKGSFSRAV